MTAVFSKTLRVEKEEIKLPDSAPLEIDMNTSHFFGDSEKDFDRRCLYELMQNFIDECYKQSAGEKIVCLKQDETTWVFAVEKTKAEVGCFVVDGNLVAFINRNATLPESAFVHGGTNKRDALTTTAGYFGDGLKLCCAMLARENVPFAFFNKGNYTSFYFSEPTDDGHRMLKRNVWSGCTPATDDLYVFVEVKDGENAKKLIMDNFLIFHTGSYVIESEVQDVGTILTNAPKMLFLGGMCPSDCDKFQLAGTFFNGPDSFSFDYTAPISKIIANYNVGRDRRLAPVAPKMCADIIMGDLLKEESVLFNKLRKEVIDPAVEEMTGATLKLPVVDKTGLFTAVVNCNNRRPLGDKLYDYLSEKVGTQYIVNANDWGMPDQFAEMVGRKVMCSIETSHEMANFLYSSRRYRSMDAIHNDITKHLPADDTVQPSPFIQGLMEEMKSVVPDIKFTLVKTTEGSSIEFPAVMYLKRAHHLVINEDLLASEHNPGCDGEDCACAYLCLLSNIDANLVKKELARRMQESRKRKSSDGDDETKESRPSKKNRGPDGRPLPPAAGNDKDAVMVSFVMGDWQTACGAPPSEDFVGKIPETVSEAEVKAFESEVENVVKKIREKIQNFPPTEIFYDDETKVTGVVEDGTIYVNMAVCKKMGDQEMLVELLHQMVHRIHRGHGEAFVGAFQDLVGNFVAA